MPDVGRVFFFCGAETSADLRRSIRVNGVDNLIGWVHGSLHTYIHNANGDVVVCVGKIHMDIEARTTALNLFFFIWEEN